MKGVSPIATVILLCCIQLAISGANERVRFGTFNPLPSVLNGIPCGAIIQEYIKDPEADPVQTVTPQNLQNDGDNAEEDATVTPVSNTEEDTTVVSLKLGRKRKYPAGSCSEIRDANPSASSRNYWLKGRE